MLVNKITFYDYYAYSTNTDILFINIIILELLKFINFYNQYVFLNYLIILIYIIMHAQILYYIRENVKKNKGRFLHQTIQKLNSEYQNEFNKIQKDKMKKNKENKKTPISKSDSNIIKKNSSIDSITDRLHKNIFDKKMENNLKLRVIKF